MRGCIVYGVLAVLAALFIAKPVTATTTDTNGTEVVGTCGPVWSMLAGSRPNYEDAVAMDGTDIGVFPDVEVVQATCQRNAVRRTAVGVVVLGAAVAVVRLRQRRAAASAEQPPRSPTAADT